MNQQPNITATGIAVAAAVVVAVALLFFGPALFTLINGTSATSTPATTASAQPAAQADQATNPTTNPTTATAPKTSMEIPANVTQLEGKDTVVGTGETAAAGDTVTVQYVGMLTDGTVFDASKNHGTAGFTFKLGAGQVIKGWDEGVAGMKVGGTRELVIPASLAYGSQSVGSIPANSTLVFQVELLDVKKGS
jgi:FKBP-type peptidyl-prolyl cis-trans isomerase